MNHAEEHIRQRLLALADAKYRSFQCRLLPTVSPEAVIGIRTPQLRAFAREIASLPDAADFMLALPHQYFEENNLHAFLIERIPDYNACLAAVNRFLPYIDNWATCDQMSPKALGKEKKRLMTEIRQWIRSGKTYTVRYGVGMLMRYYLDEEFGKSCLDMAADIRSEEYYVRMMVAWYFATALAKQYNAAAPYLEQRRLDTWTHNKTIRKALESYRITDTQKEYLRTLQIPQ